MAYNKYSKFKPLIEFKNFSYSFSKEPFIPVVKNLNFCLFPNEFIAIIGESGSGKSVTAKAILDLNSPKGYSFENSQILYGRENLLDFDEEQIRKIRGREISIVFQDPMTYLNPTATIGSQIKESLIHHFPHYSSQDVYNKTIELLKLVELSNPEEIFKSYPHELSGGMRQRVMIAISLAPNPRIFIADEITTALDVTIQHEILHLLKRLQKTLAMSIIFITHDLNIVANFADRVVVMYAGSIVETGPAEAVCRFPKHPYTKGLINSIPTLDMDKDTRLEAITIIREPTSKGCIFYNKCKYAQELCKNTKPITKQNEENSVSCHYPLSKPQKKEVLCKTQKS
ncbi:MAG: Oligopeptide transport ATP-binding protein OppD [Chlamydiia bacterium]|nr:Oligopeptide transport ATP-binding protein OppD [Chlamydiia bacterium]